MAGTYAPCPKCGYTEPQKVGYSWWGGVVGPAILTHVKCPQCGTTYNGKTGKSNTPAIVIYSIVVGLIAIGIVVLAFVLLGS